MNKGFIYSAVLHLIAASMIIFGLPVYNFDSYSKDYTILVDVVPISDITNLKASLNRAKSKTTVKEQKEKTEESKSEQKELIAQKVKHHNAESKEEEKQLEIKNTITEKTKSKEEQFEKIPTKKIRDKKSKTQEEITKNRKSNNEIKQGIQKDKKKDKKKKQDWDRIVMKSLETIKNTNKNISKKSSKSEKQGKYNNADDIDALITGETNKEYNKELPISITQLDAIRSQIEKAWNQTYYGAGYLAYENTQEMRIKIIISLTIDGTVTNVKPIPDIKSQSNPLYSKFVDSAIRAAHNASPIQNLPPESQYNLWSEIQFTFSSNGNIS